MNLWLVVEYTCNRTYHRLICDSFEEAEKLKISLTSKVDYDSFGDMLIGSNVLGPFNLNEFMLDIAIIDIDTTKHLRPKVDNNEVIAGDFKIQGPVVTILQDKHFISKVMDTVEDSIAKLSEDEEMRAKFEKMKLPKETIDAMIEAAKKSKGA